VSCVDVRPVCGFPTVVVLPDGPLTLWWGPDVAGVDVVATRDSRVLTWQDVDTCLGAVRELGWPAEEAEADVVDLSPVRAWLAGVRRSVPAGPALEAWNLAGEVAVSVDASWDDRGRLADVCHLKLTAAASPSLSGPRGYVPRWTVAQERYLRRRIGAALALLRTHLSAEAGAS